MGDYENSTEVNVGEQALFDYLADVQNLPKYFDAMQSAETTGPEAVYTVAKVEGQTVEGEAWFKVDQDRKHIEWGSEGDSGYSGQLDVTGDSQRSTVTVRLHTERTGDGDQRIEQGIVRTLANVKQLVEADS